MTLEKIAGEPSPVRRFRDGVIDGLRKYAPGSLPVTLVMLLAAYQTIFPSSDKPAQENRPTTLPQAYQAFDTNNDGVLDYDEFRRAVEKQTLDYSVE